METLVIGPKVQEMFGSIAAGYDRANTVLSFGIHHIWRYRFFKRLPKVAPLTVVDLCTGTGDLLPPLSKRYETVIGIDFCMPMLVSGKQKWSNSKDIAVMQGDGLQLPLKSDSIDLVTVAFGVRNFESLERGLREIHRVLKPGGSVRILEFGQPTGIAWGALFRFYSNFIMPIVGGLLTGNRAAYTYLPRTSAAFPCRESFIKILENAGYRDCFFESLTGGIAYVYGARVP